MTRVDHFKTAYASLKETIIGEIRDIVRHQDDGLMELLETRKTPALVTQTIDDQESETIHELFIDDRNNVIASAGIYEDDVNYNLYNFEVPFLIQILDSAIIHTEE
jgi:DNA repair protein RadC